MCVDVMYVVVCRYVVFFFKQKTAYEIQYGLVGSEMCIRDSLYANYLWSNSSTNDSISVLSGTYTVTVTDMFGCCLLYTSDAADERSSVDLGGRRIIKKKKKHKFTSIRQHKHHKQIKQ